MRRLIHLTKLIVIPRTVSADDGIPVVCQFIEVSKDFTCTTNEDSVPCIRGTVPLLQSP